MNMGYAVSNEEIKKIAAQLGLEVSFDNPPEKCGVVNTTTGEFKPMNQVGEELFEFLGVTEEERNSLKEE